ncbi:hypothetical protein BJ165DRAFT_151073 [Panaeolus papilionaceus]|nr:hypothetical protein BJ165DRAFT_151073 [Panaeolus papilionaceus]
MLTLSTPQRTPLHILRPFIDLRFPNISLLHLIPKFPLLLFDLAENDVDALQPQHFLSVFPSLHTLRINIPRQYHPVIFQSRMLLPLLFSVPSTVSLSIAAAYTLKQIVDVLDIINNVTMSNHPILPNLQQLSIGICIPYNFELRQIESAFINSLFLACPSTVTGVIAGEEANNATTTNINNDLEEEGVFDYRHFPSNLSTQRLGSLRIRSQLANDFDQGRLEALENYRIDIAFEVSDYSFQDIVDQPLRLCADVPYNCFGRDWYTRYF